MSVFSEITQFGHEQVVFCSDVKAGLRAIIAVHNTTLGPALGGTRMWNYASDEHALTDALRLSRGMTYKAAISGLNLGGGKAVIIGNPNTDKTPQLFRSYGRFVESLNGKYITAEDVGTNVHDMETVQKETSHVTGIDQAFKDSGDPSPLTALGVYYGIKACMKETSGTDSLSGKRIAVQGAGNVAGALCDFLSNEGAKIFITDIYEHKAQSVAARTNATLVKPDGIYDVEAEVFCPCALGAILNDHTIPQLKARIVAGAANNQLADEQTHGMKLLERGILYAPDYVINAGGLISVANQLDGNSYEQAKKQIEGIYETLHNIFSISKEKKLPTYQAANHLAEERLTQNAHRSKGKLAYSGNHVVAHIA
ncbi:MAG: Glu/Leu/Phe/Val dehydrogenase [Ignavibacteriales bacterium]|nr:Glu/Leu/Phe/Val dehydrogenase [Ignavibacteriales bacterium]